MGCDIHIVLESRHRSGTKWVGEWSTRNYNVVGKGLHAKKRDYGFFGRVAGVRGQPNNLPRYYPQNMPRDVSDLAWDSFMDCPTDYHSPSHLGVHQFCEAWIAENPDNKEVRKEHVLYDLLGVDDDDLGARDYRVVFWFDN
jgi:hypothetical protein